MKAAISSEGVVQRTLTRFLFDLEAGRSPDPEAYAAQCPDEASREEFRRALKSYPYLPMLLSLDRLERERLGPYRVERELGRGGMARVLEVWDENLQRSLAVKVNDEVHLNADGSVPPGRETKVARFLQEAQITSQLRHPGIVPVHQLDIDSDGRMYFTMQLIEETTLADIFDRRKKGDSEWTLSKTMRVLLKVCEAVAFAHSQGIIHRDLKPQNIMVGQFGEVYVVDWGLAKYLDPEVSLAMTLSIGGTPGEPGVLSPAHDASAPPAESLSLTSKGQVLGTLSYISPEQVRNPEEVGFPTDAYAIGAILYELLSGRPPLLEEDLSTSSIDAGILERIHRHVPPPLEEVAPRAPAELVAICKKAIARDPAHRYASLLDLHSDLQAFEEKRVVGAYATGAVAELRKWFQRNRPMAIVAVTAFALVLTSWLLFEGARLRAARQEILRNDYALLSELLRQRDDGLHVVTADRIDAAESWLDDSRILAARYGDGDVLTAAIDPSFHSRIEAFREEAIPAVQEAVARARETTGRDWQALWDRACAEIEESDRYGFRLAPQVGLLPLGMDPDSQLYEFVDLYTGEAPSGQPGDYVIEEKTGLVFVLLPGARFWFGSQAENPAGPNYLPPSLPRVNELSPSLETLGPFLISKYEMTQGQWLRVTGENPSQYAKGSYVRGWGTPSPLYRETDLTHPVELVTWKACDEILSLIGSRLPTELEWEYAARAGTDTPWSTGREKDSLLGHANIADDTARKANLPTGDWIHWPGFDDGHAWHAPVGSFRPNPFGLHDVHGNVWEWCDSDWTFDAGEIEIRTVGTPTKVTRGGGWNNRAEFVRSSYRIGASFSVSRSSIGVRPVRDVRFHGE